METTTLHKDSTVSARIQSDIKTEAEDVLKQLGVPVSVVIDSLYRQIIMTRSIPFQLALPPELKTLDSMTESERNAMLEHSYAQALAGDGYPAKEVFRELRRKSQHAENI